MEKERPLVCTVEGDFIQKAPVWEAKLMRWIFFWRNITLLYLLAQGTGMILRSHTYLKVYKCWRILPTLKIPSIKWLVIFFKKYFNFQGFYIVYIIILRILGWKFFTLSKLGERGLQKMQNDESFLGKKNKNCPLG